jgi:hypothetical protein
MPVDVPGEPRPRLGGVEALLVGLCLGFFLLFGAAWISLPGPQQDELLHLPVLSPQWRSDALFSAKIAHRYFPLMIMSYVGALKGWLLWLWFRVVPQGMPGYRAFGVAAGLGTLLLTFWFVRRWWASAVALLTTALTASDPTFIHTIRLDFGPVALAHLFKMGGLCLLVRWLDTRSRRALAAGMFLFGLGIWDKANFIWFLAGLGGTVVLLFPRQTFDRLRGDLPAVALGLAAFLVGTSPFIAYNLKRSGETWRERGRLEVRWFKLLQAQGTFDGAFMLALAGEDNLDLSPPAHDLPLPGLANWMYRAGRLRRTIQLPLVALSLALLPLNLWIGRPRALLFPLLLALLTYAAMFVSFDGGSSAHHVIMLQPFVLLFVAASLWTPVERWPHFAPRAAALAVVAAALVVNFSVNARLLAVYTRTGGTLAFSDAMYRLVPYLGQHPERNLYALDWGFSKPVMFLGARWNLNVDDWFFALTDTQNADYPEQLKHLAERMRDPHSVFLLHSPQRTLVPLAAQTFFDLADHGIPMRQVAFFEERTGQMVYEVYQSAAGAPAASPVETPPEVEVQFTPEEVHRNQDYVVRVPELANAWIDVVYHLNRTSSGTVLRYCHLDGEGRATLTVPATHPEATVRITLIRPTGGQWRPARGSIKVVP